MNYSKKHCKQIAYKQHQARFVPTADLFPFGAPLPKQIYLSTAMHYGNTKKIYRW